ncbi:MAG: butyrate kinase [candidate division KSB1 bacterium]|nr:butyrate kinase [candidate division KSB1 bacterium]
MVINPGSTSDKLALFEGDKEIASETIRYRNGQLDAFASLFDQLDFRSAAVDDFLTRRKINQLDAVVGRGGLLKPVRRGVYRVNAAMLEDARRGVQGVHPANLGCALAARVAERFGCPALVVDPVSVDEFEPVARLSGHPLIERRSLSHALNLRAAAIWAAEQQGREIEQVSYVIAHLGGGISVAAIRKGRIIDVNDASNAGPFSPERSGSLPMTPFAELCFSGKYTLGQIKKMIMGEGGIKAYLGTADVTEVEQRIAAGDSYAALVYDAMIYQIAKEIGAMATVLCGDLQGIVFTGGLAQSKQLTNRLSSRVSFLAPILILPGEREAEAMALGALRALSGREPIQEYE